MMLEPGRMGAIAAWRARTSRRGCLQTRSKCSSYFGYAARLHHLVGSVVDEDVYPPELVRGLLHDVLTVGLVLTSAGHPNRLSAGLSTTRAVSRASDSLPRGRDQDVGTLAGEGERDGPTIPESPARYDRLLAL